MFEKKKKKRETAGDGFFRGVKGRRRSSLLLKKKRKKRRGGEGGGGKSILSCSLERSRSSHLSKSPLPDVNLFFFFFQGFVSSEQIFGLQAWEGMEKEGKERWIEI